MHGVIRLQEFITENQLGGFILSNQPNLQYFTGFTGTTAIAFITEKEAYIITDGRYTEQAGNECEGFAIVEHHSGAWETLCDILTTYHKEIEVCGFEYNKLTVDSYDTMKKNIAQNVSFKGYALESLRRIKRNDELVLLRKAAQIADEAFSHMLRDIRVGLQEWEVHAILESHMLQLGASGPSFDTIIASGYRSSMPHGVASDKRLERGDFVTVDFGAIYKGYHSDMTRTFVMGEASSKQKELYDIVLRAQEYGVSLVKPGICGKDLDERVRHVIQEAGYGEYYPHGLGHGIGLDIHELPVASPRSTDILALHDVITIEPGIYIPKEMGLRIEDSCIVTEIGAEVITKTSKELLEIHAY